jgi:predicted nicotinamide N-methyase
MEMPEQVQREPRTYSRRRVLRKAAYTAPAVVAIAAAPKVALGHSGPGCRHKKNSRGGGGKGRR